MGRKPGEILLFPDLESEVLETLYNPVTIEIDIEARRGRIEVAEMIESTGSPIINQLSGAEHRAQIHLPNGFEYTVAEMGSGISKTWGL